MGVGGQHHAPTVLSPTKAPGTHSTEGWVGQRACLDGCGKSRPHRDSIPGPSSRSESLYRLLYPDLPVTSSNSFVSRILHLYIRPFLINQVCTHEGGFIKHDICTKKIISCVACDLPYSSSYPLYPVHSKQLTYIHHGFVGHRNKFSSCQCELLVGCGNDENQAALKRDRSSYPVAAPCCVSHTFSLE